MPYISQPRHTTSTLAQVRTQERGTPKMRVPPYICIGPWITTAASWVQVNEISEVRKEHFRAFHRRQPHRKWWVESILECCHQLAKDPWLGVPPWRSLGRLAGSGIDHPQLL